MNKQFILETVDKGVISMKITHSSIHVTLTVLALLFLGFVFFVSCSSGGSEEDDTVLTITQFVSADTGGTVSHPSGARLIIPANALSGDTTVSISDSAYEPFSSDDLLLRLSKRFIFDIGEATLGLEAILELDHVGLQTASVQSLQVGGESDNRLLGTRDADGSIRLRSFSEESDSTTVKVSLKEEFDRTTAPLRTFEVLYIPNQDITIPPPILSVPYYWQDNLPWCVPTSLGMVMNYYDGLEGIVANFQLAGADSQGADEGNAYVEILGSFGVDDEIYKYLKWDADLIPNAPFRDYLKLHLKGYNLQDLYGEFIDVGFQKIPVPDVNIPPRALALSSTTTSHAFVGVGATNDHVWVSDPSGAFSGDASIAEKLTWQEFRTVAMDDAQSEELRTLIFFKSPKPAGVRRGSIVLEEGGAGSSIVYERPANSDASRWQWDGSMYERGYFWDDPGMQLPADQTYGKKFNRDPASGQLQGNFDYKLRVANVTSKQRDYQVWVRLGNVNNPSMEVNIHDITVPPYTWKTANIAGTLSDFSSITSDGDYFIKFELYEKDELQDNKVINFRVGDGPIMP
jgi:hypothetical protein